jgi:hypothetical protein
VTEARDRAAFDGWLAQLSGRHVAPLGRPAFLKALRALSARYVEHRASLSDRSALDSAGKRAAFAAFYAPLHYLVVARVVAATGAGNLALDTIVDLGCGSGAASAAWALALTKPPTIEGVDTHPWTIAEARWTWATLGLRGRARQEDLVRAATRHVERAAGRAGVSTSLLCGWSVNELSGTERDALLPRLLEAATLGMPVLVVEPIARSATPWWASWQREIESAGGRSDEWRFDVPLPPMLADLDEAAGFRREELAAKSFWLDPRHVTRRAGSRQDLRRPR